MQTMLRRYGVPYGNALTYKRKIYEDKFGTIHKVQGYEHHAIKWLEERKPVTSIVSSIPRIPYEYDGNRVYLPDILATSKGKHHIIEVKSSWTLALDMHRVVAKCIAATKYAKE